MEFQYKLIDDTRSFEEFRSLLKASGLPADDLSFSKNILVGYYEGDDLVGTGGLEIHGDFALLRSLSVKLGIRGKAIGTALTEYLLSEAKKKNLKAVYLLTETAHGFFQKKGFVDVSRDDVPAEVRASSEFASVCPETAAVMFLPIG